MTGFRSIVTRRLFSIDYLTTRLPGHRRWRHSARERSLLDDVRRIFEEAGPLLDTGTEEQIRNNVVDRILELLNPYYLAGETLATGLKPDYIFFQDPHSKQTKNIASAISVGEAKPPGKDFDRASGERSPVRQTYDYMTDTQTKWAILTDGRRWRLLHGDSPTDRSLEVDLFDIATRNDADEWLYFCNLFGREAFVKDAGKSFLDEIKNENAVYEQAVGKELKERVYSALRQLAEGFVDWPENHLNPADQEVRQRVRSACFILLYRLLFVFFAESRNLLPRDAGAYRQMSLESLRERVKGASRDDSHFSSESRQLWTGLKDLFRLVDRGSASLGVAPYNGGLFSRTGRSLPHADFLDQYEIADKHLASALDLLGTAPSQEDPSVFANVDYAGLEIRHLGSIYESLLEFHLAFAETDLVSVKRNRSEVWIPVSEYTGRTPVEDIPVDRRAKKGELYLETTRHERRATGSYYTTEPVVRYIVRHALGPVIDERRTNAAKRGARQSDAVLGIRICDPAMGSGHFLVESVQVLAEALLRALEDDQGRGLAEAQEYDLDWARREVVRRCIYGVDMNDLAVELAKVSLWLVTISKDKPLSFLDHRLKCGNSLLGTDLASLKYYPDRRRRKPKRNGPALPDFISRIFIERLIGKVNELEAVRDDRIEDVKRKERIFSEFVLLAEYAKTKAIADVWTSVHFGNEVAATETRKPKDVYYDLIYTLDYPSDWESRTKTQWFRQAIQIAGEKKFFHWELEFPDVFLSSERTQSETGFDAVVGNPPYVNALQLARSGDPLEKEFIHDRFTMAGAFDLYVPFIELAQRLVRVGGRSGLITPNKFLAAPYAKALRHLLCRKHTLERFLDASQADVFEDPAVYPVVTVFRKEVPADAAVVTVELLRKGESTPIPKGTLAHSLLSSFPEDLWGVLLARNIPLISRIAAECKRLEPSFARVQASTTAGEAAGFAAIMSECTGPEAHHDHFMVANTGIIDRYELRWGVDTMTHEHRQYRRPCVSKEDPRLSQMRRELFARPKLIVAKVAYVPEVCIDTHGGVAGVNVNFIVDAHANLAALLGILNSKLMSYIYREYFAALTMQRAYAQFQAPQLRILPIPGLSGAIEHEDLNALLKRSLGLDFPLAVDGLERAEAFIETWTKERFGPIAAHPPLTMDVLAFMASLATHLHQRKMEESRIFLDWVQSPAGMGIDISSLRNRDTIRRFADDPQLGSEGGRRGLESVLAENRVALRPAQLRGFADEYTRSSAAILPILKRISRLEELTDFLVYRLYQLTDDEVASVETIHAEYGAE